MSDASIEFDIILEHATATERVSLAVKYIEQVSPVLKKGRMFAHGARSVVLYKKEGEDYSYYFSPEMPEKMQERIKNAK